MTQPFVEQASRIEAIQSCGCLLRFNAALTQVQQVSENIEHIIGITIETALSSSPRELLGVKLLERIEKALVSRQRLVSAAVISRQVAGTYERFYVMAYHSSDSIVVELELLSRAGEQRLMPIVNEWLGRLSDVNDIAQLQQMLVQGVQVVTGFDRVMLCQFDANWHRTVIAEVCRDPQRSLLHYRFPASDIAESIRQRYEINGLRSIPDVNAAHVNLVPAASQINLPTLDLTHGMLRAVSAYHQEYLHDIKVAASLSIAINGEESLWGLVTCHGFKPNDLTPSERDAAFNLVQMATQRLFLLKSRSEATFLKQVMDSRELLSTERDKVIQPTQLLDKYAMDWMQLFECTGIALIYHDQVRCFGETLEAYELAIVSEWLTEHHPRIPCWMCDHLSISPLNALVDVRNRAGLLAMPLPIEKDRPGWLLMFRRAASEAYRWVGKKEAIEAVTENPLLLVEERGFDIWLEEVKDKAPRWTLTAQQAAQDLAEDLAVAITVYQIHRLNQQLKRTNKQLKEIAHTDALTKIWNRYRMELAIDAEMAAAIRYGHSCSVLLFDVDHFKSVNDTHGHDVGDQVLTRLAQEVQSMLRVSDFFGRWGGEEFIVLAPHNTLEQAAVLADRLREHVAQLEFELVGQITISIGVAELTTTEDARRQFLERADKAMYQAKQAGRNQVKLAPP